MTESLKYAILHRFKNGVLNCKELWQAVLRNLMK